MMPSESPPVTARSRNIGRETEQGHLVADEVARVKRDDGSLNEEEFAAIGKRTGVGGSTKVKELLNSDKVLDRAREPPIRIWAGKFKKIIGVKNRG